MDAEVAFDNDEIRVRLALRVVKLNCLWSMLVLDLRLASLSSGALCTRLCIFFRILNLCLRLSVSWETQLRRHFGFLALSLLLLFLQMVVELVNLSCLESSKVVLVNELGTSTESRFEKVVVLVIGALSKVVNPLLVDQLGGVNTHESKNLALYNWFSVFSEFNFFFHSALFFVIHQLNTRLARMQLDE